MSAWCHGVERGSGARRAALWCGLALLAMSLGSACRGEDSGVATPNGEETPPGASRGERCDTSSPCREGLTCLEQTCDYVAEVELGAACQVTAQCAQGLYCDPLTEACATAGDHRLGDACEESSQCEAGLTCRTHGLGATCQAAGEVDLGGACEGHEACLAGASCLPTMADPTKKVCVSGPESVEAFPFNWVDCTASDEESGPARFFFEVARGGEPLSEFFRAPFPNDARLDADDHPNLSGFPLSDSVDVVARYSEAVARDQRYWGVNQPIHLRSSVPLDFKSVNANDDAATPEDDRTLALIDITPGSPSYLNRHPISWEARGDSGSRQRYICQNWLAARPFWGRPLLPNTTYALVVFSEVRTSAGEAMTQDEDFTAMLAEAAPEDNDLARAWTRYAPLRAWMKEEGRAGEELLAASVFTTGDPLSTMSTLREVARATPARFSDVVRCEQGVRSPCERSDAPEPEARACHASNALFHELHGHIALPIVQQGEAPYASEGGDVAEIPKVERVEQVCAAMTVPKAQMPANGWPLLIYAHGTRGSFTEHEALVAPALSAPVMVDGEELRFVVLGWEQVLHGARQGQKTMSDPWPMVHDLANPRLARGAMMQGAVDLFAVVKLAQELKILPQDSPTGELIFFDPTRIYFLGHSQGGTSGMLALPFEPEIEAAVISGTGGGVSLQLMGQTWPADSAKRVKVALQDPDASTIHPALSLIQGYLEPVDPINYAPYLSQRQIEGLTQGKHLFQVFGVGDTISPPESLKALARALYATYLGPIFDDMGGGVALLEQGTVSSNRKVGESFYTLVGKQYTPTDGQNGHTVFPYQIEALMDVATFLRSALAAQGTPSLSSP